MPVNFDVDGARKAGYTDTEIADAIAKKAGFDSTGARQAGYQDADIISRLVSAPAPQRQVAPAVPQMTASQKAQQELANNTGIGETLLVGAGRTFDRIGKGMQQGWYALTGNEKEQAALKQRAADDDALYKPLQDAHPIATSVGESLPAMAVPVGGAGATALGATAKLATAAAIPAALEYGSVGERAKRAAGAAAGAAVGGVLIPKVAGAALEGGKAALKGLAGNITPEALALAARAEALGIPVNAAQLGDSKFLKTLASSIEQMPFTGGAATAAAQRSAYTKAVGKTFGADVEKITPEVYNFHKQRLGDTFEDLASRNQLNVSPDLQSRLAGIVEQATATGSDDTIRAVNNIVGRVGAQGKTVGGANPTNTLYHGGTYTAGQDINGVLFTAADKKLAESYTNMHSPNGSLSSFTHTAAKAAPEDVVRATAKKYGIDPDEYTPASMFDRNLQPSGAVEKLVADLRKQGFDHTKLDDIGFGTPQVEGTAHILFPGVKTAAANSAPVSTKLAGDAYMSIDSELGNLIKAGGEKGLYAKRLQSAIREGMDGSISAADQAAWKETRDQYKNLKAVRNIVARDGGDGNIPPSQLMNALNGTEAGKEAMAMGTRGTLGELGQIGKQFVRDSVPNSGTAQRAMAMGLIGGGGYAFGADPTTIAGMMAGGATAGRLINKVLTSPKTVEALSKQGITIGELAKLPPDVITQILGGLSGMSVANQMGNK